MYRNILKVRYMYVNYINVFQIYIVLYMVRNISVCNCCNYTYTVMFNMCLCVYTPVMCLCVLCMLVYIYIYIYITGVVKESLKKPGTSTAYTVQDIANGRLQQKAFCVLCQVGSFYNELYPLLH